MNKLICFFFVFISLFPKFPKFCFIAVSPILLSVVVVYGSVDVLFRCVVVGIEDFIEVFIELFDKVLIDMIIIRRVPDYLGI